MSHGLTLFANFTYAKGLDLSSTSANRAFPNTIGLRDPFDLNLDKGPPDSDLKYQFKLASVYDIPFLHGGNAVLRALANGWAFNTIWVARTGLPFTCRSGVDNSLSGVSLDHCDQVSPNIARPAGVSQIQEFFNTAAFTTNAIGTFGTVGRNSLRRPASFNVNASALFRIFPITETRQAGVSRRSIQRLQPRRISTCIPLHPGGYVDSEEISDQPNLRPGHLCIRPQALPIRPETPLLTWVHRPCRADHRLLWSASGQLSVA